MTTKIQKWGNSHAVRLPKALVDEAGLREGSAIEIRAEGEGISIKPARQIRRIPIKDLVKGMTPGKNRYPEFDDAPIGKELI